MASVGFVQKQCQQLCFFLHFQFSCDNGRIILSLKAHEWNKSDVSSKFSGVTSVSEFVTKWHEEIQISQTRREHGEKRKNEARSPNPLSPSLSFPRVPSNFGVCISPPNGCYPSPSKRLKYIKEGIDEQIERCRIAW